MTVWVGTSEISISSTQTSKMIMPAIQRRFVTLQITEHAKQLSKMLSEAGPNNHQKLFKIHPGSFQDPSECICARFHHQHGIEIVPMTSKWTQHCYSRAMKGDENRQSSVKTCVTQSSYVEKYSTNFNHGNLPNSSTPFRLQITSRLVTRGAGGRGEALRIRPHPAGVKGVSRALAKSGSFQTDPSSSFRF